MTHRSSQDDASEPDPTVDSWSAWLPRLDPSTTPLPQASAPPDSTTPPAPVPPPAAPPSSPPSPPMRWYAASPPPAPAPPVGGPQPYTPPPPNRLALAILCTIFCFTPFGIVAIVKATSVNSLWAQGRWGEAYRTSRSVKNWCILAALAWPGSALLFACTGMLGLL